MPRDPGNWLYCVNQIKGSIYVHLEHCPLVDVIGSICACIYIFIPLLKLAKQFI